MIETFSVLIYNETTLSNTLEIYRMIDPQQSGVHTAQPVKTASARDQTVKQPFGTVTVPPSSHTTFTFLVDDSGLLPGPLSKTGLPAPPYLARIIPQISQEKKPVQAGDDTGAADPEPLKLDFSSNTSISISIIFAHSDWKGASGNKTVSLHQS